MDTPPKASIISRIKTWARNLKQELVALQISLTYKLVPWYVKALIIMTIAFALSPIDLIPDFIPIIGLLDDIILVPMLIYLIIKLMPPGVLEECRKLAETRALNKKKNWLLAIVVILIWIAIGFAVYRLINHYYKEE